MSARRAPLDPADVQCPRGELDLIPTEVNEFGGTKAVTIGDQDHRGEDGNTSDPLNPKRHPAEIVRRRLADWVRKLGVTDDELSPMHGWRHTFKARADRAGITERTSDYITGHAQRQLVRSTVHLRSKTWQPRWRSFLDTRLSVERARHSPTNGRDSARPSHDDSAGCTCGTSAASSWPRSLANRFGISGLSSIPVSPISPPRNLAQA